MYLLGVECRGGLATLRHVGVLIVVLDRDNRSRSTIKISWMGGLRRNG